MSIFGAKYDVFLSYSRADTALVAPLRDELRRLGYAVFFDVQSIDPGEQWKRRLERAIAGSRTLVLCWSARTAESQYIMFEYSRAEALHKKIYPWLLDGTSLPAMLEIQGLTSPDAALVAGQLQRSLGWTLPARRRLLGAALALLLAVTAADAKGDFEMRLPLRSRGRCGSCCALPHMRAMRSWFRLGKLSVQTWRS